MPIVAFLLAFSAARASEPTTDAEDLEAFARLYGVIRWFHPSDEAAAADWRAVAVDGAARALAATDRASLEAALEATFLPLAPTLDVHPEGTAPSDLPAWPEGPVVAWQHVGFGDGGSDGTYASKRTGRVLREYDPQVEDWARLATGIDATPLRGRTVRLTARVRLDAPDLDDAAAMWLRVDLPTGEMGFFDNMQDRRVTSTEWTTAVIEGPVALDAVEVVFGGLVLSRGAARFDDYALSVLADDGTWEPVVLDNPAFQYGLEGWVSDSAGWNLSVVDGAASLERAYEVRADDLFDERPAVGELAEGALGAGLAYRVPIGLPDVDGHTWPVATEAPAPKPTGVDATGAGAVVVAWSALHHFYPYFDVVEVDWDAALDDAIARVLVATGPADVVDTLSRLLAGLRDGHAGVTGPGEQWSRVAARFGRVEGQIVVTVAAEGSGFVRGDEVVSIDGVPIEEALAARAERVSGSPQWVEERLLTRCGVTYGPDGSTTSFVVRRDGAEQVVEAVRGHVRLAREFEHPPMELLDGGVWYVDLAKVTLEEIHEKRRDLAAAPGVIFDMRGYPNGTHPVLSLLLTERDRSEWMFADRRIRPEGPPVGVEALGWEMRPRKPHIRGEVAFLTGAGAISYAESIVGMVEYYDLGEIVGSATAGANGDIGTIYMPGGYESWFTALRVVRGDGSPHHAIGVQPTVPAGRTLAGVREGRDEVLETALAIVSPKAE